MTDDERLRPDSPYPFVLRPSSFIFPLATSGAVRIVRGLMAFDSSLFDPSALKARVAGLRRFL